MLMTTVRIPFVAILLAALALPAFAQSGAAPSGNGISRPTVGGVGISAPAQVPTIGASNMLALPAASTTLAA